MVTAAADSQRAVHPRAPRPTRNSTGGTRFRRKVVDSLTAGGFLVPNMVLMTVFLLLPLVFAFVISFQRSESIGKPKWIGLTNFQHLLSDAVFWTVLRNTVLFTLITVPLEMALGLGVAVLLNGVLPARTFFRAVIFLPLVLAGVTTGLLGSWMFDQYNGFVNKALAVIGITGPAWQSNGTLALISIVMVTLWMRLGFNMIIYLAGLQGVNPELHEAARVDGASSWTVFRRITVPLLGPSTFFLLIMNMIYSFQVFDTVFAMTGGGPGFSTTMLVTYAYKTGFDEHGSGELGYAAAIGVVIYLITLTFTVLQWRFSRTRDEAG